jgi:hypothetical protein
LQRACGHFSSPRTRRCEEKTTPNQYQPAKPRFFVIARDRHLFFQQVRAKTRAQRGKNAFPGPQTGETPNQNW